MTTTEGESAEKDFLETVDLFSALTPALRAQLLPAFETVHVPAGSWLFRRGDPGDALLVVRTGRLEVVVDSPAGPERAELLGPGGVLGELALLLGGVRTASARALRETELLQLRKAAFDELLRHVPAFAAAITRTLAQELSRRVPPSTPRPRDLAVVAVIGVTPSAPTAELAGALCGELATWGPVTQVEAPAAAFDEAEVGRTIGRLEQSHSTVLLVAPSWPDPDGWARFCVRQADAVIGVVDPLATPGPADEPGPRGCDVLFWGSRFPDGRLLGRWLDRLQSPAHHLVSPGSTQRQDVARLARRLSGHSLGIVLSGGGARGLAHIGVLSTLMQAGYTIDRVGGTSMGSLVGALFALGLEPAEIQHLCLVELVQRKPFNDYTVPRHGLIKARKAADMLHRLFGDAHIEATRRSLFTMSADLVTGDEVVHRRGPVAAAVGASMCLPGLVPPVVDRDRLLVDGGVLNNLPVDVMAEGREGPIIAVDVMRRGRAVTPDSATPRPSMVETLSRASVLGSRRKTDSTRRLASLVIAPDLPDVGLLDFRQFPRILAEGRHAAETALEGDLSALDVLRAHASR